MRKYWRRRYWIFLTKSGAVFLLIILNPTIASAKKVIIFTFSRRKDCQQIWQVKKDLQKLKIEEHDLPRSSKLYTTRYYGQRARNYITFVKIIVFYLWWHSQNQNYWKLFSAIQKQPPRGVPGKRCSKNIQQIYRRTPMPKCDFTSAWGCSPVNLLHIFRTPFLRTPLGGFFWLLVTHADDFRNCFLHVDLSLPSR